LHLSAASRAALSFIFMLAVSETASASCTSTPQGEGRVTAIIDARTIRLDDGREVRLSGIETNVAGLNNDPSALASLIAGRDVTLQGEDDRPDRYGRQAGLVFLAGAPNPIQIELLSKGAAVRALTVPNRDCSAEWATAENRARDDRIGLWGSSSATKNAEMPGDILADTGRLAIVEGKVLSARQAGATFYINFGRRWTRDFAVTISRRMMPSFEAAGFDFKALEGKTVRVRGWVEKRGGPRIDLTSASQIELIGARTAAAGGKSE
jgi:hypothetical protein